MGREDRWPVGMLIEHRLRPAQRRVRVVDAPGSFPLQRQMQEVVSAGRKQLIGVQLVAVRGSGTAVPVPVCEVIAPEVLLEFSIEELRSHNTP